MSNHFVVSIKQTVGEFEKTIKRLVVARSPEEAQEVALNEECQGSLEDGTAERDCGGVADMCWTFFYKIVDCQRVHPDHVDALREYLA